MVSVIALIEARAWLLDCGCDPDRLRGEPDTSVIREINRIYSGGWRQFMVDIGPLL